MKFTIVYNKCKVKRTVFYTYRIHIIKNIGENRLKPVTQENTSISGAVLGFDSIPCPFSCNSNKSGRLLV